MTGPELIKALEEANGAILYWQLPHDAVVAALASGDARRSETDDCLIHRAAYRVGDGCYSMSRDDAVTAIAEAFAEVLRQWLTPEELAEVKRRNQSHDPDVCASHDFCDANMAMLAAFEQVTGRTPCSDGDGEARHQEDCKLWGDAWSLAKKLYLTD